jgi:hypothetical protein
VPPGARHWRQFAVPWWRLHAPVLGGAALVVAVAVAVLIRAGATASAHPSSEPLAEDPQFYEDRFLHRLSRSEMDNHG